MTDDKKAENERGQTGGTKFDDTKEVKDSEGKIIKVGDRVIVNRHLYNPANPDTPDIEEGEVLTVEHITTDGELWLLEVRDLMNGIEPEMFTRLCKEPERPHDHGDPEIWQYSTSDHRKCKVCGLEQVRTGTNGPFRDSMSQPEDKPCMDNARVCPCADLSTDDDMTCNTNPCPHSGTPEPGDIPEEKEPEGVPMGEMPEMERRPVRFLEIDERLWNLFKKNREPKVGDIFRFNEGTSKVIDIKTVEGMIRIYYELSQPPTYIRCPWCNEPMDYRGNVTNQAEIVVYTCKEDMVEVTVHEPCNDRDMADFLEEYYPDEVEKEGNDS
jgi:hypothetical protein